MGPIPPHESTDEPRRRTFGSGASARWKGNPEVAVAAQGTEFQDTYWLGQAQLALGRHAEAEESFTELTAYARDVGSSGAFCTAHAWGCLHLARGEYADARRRLLEGVEVARALHDPMFETRVLIDLLDPRLYDRRDLRVEIGQGEHVVEVARDIDYPYLLAGVLERLARLRAAAGDDTAARHLADEAAAVPCGANDRHTQRPGRVTVPVVQG
ncbi:tetratricopeptide repeat protein [Streptomyces sp. DSM 40750]|uniref:tetratricopeptide repeat protein n=1 Tax=Streptomyces sp. DSM 40750 TaxID=2801030 RepID=UPI00214CC378|nr:tetratricopeptide repeat protein [Streptomyces sp. DSM 40750]UUU21910.1 tetratricopeptide repeat protein [Streptomyces sp. DSM 40750]